MKDIETYLKSAKFIEKHAGVKAKTALILGSGIGGVCSAVEDAKIIPYSEIPGFLRSTVDSHKGELVCGKLNGVPVIVMSGRFHYYEGYEFEDTAYPVYVMKLLGVDNLIVTNAAGGINRDFSPGDLMVISDHIKFTSNSPARGATLPQFGQRFFDMTNAYDKKLSELFVQTAKEKGVAVQKGVYAYMAGPQFETPAEIKMLGILGADAVGMSTVAEVIAAAQCGMKTLGVSCISNMAAGITGNAITDEEVTEITAGVVDTLKELFSEFIVKI